MPDITPVYRFVVYVPAHNGLTKDDIQTALENVEFARVGEVMRRDVEWDDSLTINQSGIRGLLALGCLFGEDD